MLEHHLACQCQACLEAELDEDINNYYAELYEELHKEEEDFLDIDNYTKHQSEYIDDLPY